MKVVLVQPRGSNWVPGQADMSVIANRMAPLNLLSLAACLEKDGHEVAIHDGLGPFAPATLALDVDRVVAARPDLVGFTCTTSSFLDAHEMARAIKDRLPATKTVVGGVFASAVGPGLLDRFDAVDHLVLGEGERTLCELASGRRPEEIPGLALRDGGAARATAPRPPIEDLDALPFPAYRLLAGFPRRYHLPLFNTPAAPGATLVASRGCPYKCSFCDRSVYGRSFRTQSPSYTYEHMAWLRRDFGVRHINIYDDLFTLNRKRVLELCELIARRPLRLSFNCALHVGHTDDEMARMLARAGCWMVSLGIETGDPEMMKRHKPGVRFDQIRPTVERLRSAGLKVKGLFIAGLPGETRETLRRTIDFYLALDLDEMNLSKFTPFHGTPLWDRIREWGSFDEDWRRMNCNNFVFVPNGFASAAELEAMYAQGVKAFYVSPAWRRRFLRRAWACRHTIWVLIKNLPAMLRAKRGFERNLLPAETGR